MPFDGVPQQDLNRYTRRRVEAEELHLDFETYSELDVRQVGAFRYARHPSTEIILASWSYGDEPLQTWRYGQRPPKRLLELIRSGVKIVAHNVQFEYCILKWVATRQWGSKHYLPKHRNLDCTAARAAMCSLPRSLEMMLEALELPVKKYPAGKRLINVFCKPRKPTKNDPSTRIYPEDRPEDWEKFVRYNRADVLGERAASKVLPHLPPFERKIFLLDFKINERGIPIDMPLVHSASYVVKALENDIRRQVRAASNGINPTQRDRMLDWFKENGLELENLQAKTVEEILKTKKIPPKLRRVLELRVEGSKASTKKLGAMARVADPEDHRARGTQLYYGAHTGRQAGKLIQPHNYMRGLLKFFEQQRVFKLLRQEDPEIFKLLFPKPVSEIAQCMRGFIKAPGNKVFWIADYAAIEARVLAWVADDRNSLRDYRQGLDAYKVMAALMFNVTYDTVSDEQRRIAKNAVLGCGYGLGDKKFVVYCANNGAVITPELAKKAIQTYRTNRKPVVNLWYDVERAAIAAVRKPGKVVKLRMISFVCEEVNGYEFLKIGLPSGRHLYYPKPRLTNGEKWGKPCVTLGFKHSLGRLWITRDTYGGRLVENIVQAIARDIMCCGMLNAEEAGYPIILTVHDEVIAEYWYGEIKKYVELLCRLEPWAEGCPIAAEGFLSVRYRKG